MTQQLRSIAVVSCAKVLAILYGILGLLIGALFSLFFLIGAAVAPAAAFPVAANRGVISLMFGVGSIVFFPICYAVIGAVGGLVMAGLYNVIASHVGGIEIEIG